MDKKQKSILIWILTWAGLLLAVLYSPVGSPDLYTPIHYFSTNQGVMFQNTGVVNEPTIRTRVDKSSPSFKDQNYPSEVKNEVVKAVSGNTFESQPNSSFYAVNNNIQSKQTKVNNIGGSVIEIGSMKSQSTNNNTATQNTGIISTTTGMTMSEDFSSNRQKASTETDPGGDLFEPPPGPGEEDPVPVGDGWIFLLVLVSVYTVWIRIRI